MSGTTGPNPLIQQGTLNRIRGSIVVASDATLNITASFLGKEGITVTPEGGITEHIPTMTGAVTSPEPYQLCTIEAHLLRTQSLAAAYKARIESNSLLGELVVTPDSSALPAYSFNNCAIAALRPLRIDGTDAGFVLSLRGVYLINSALWNLI